MSVPAHRPYWPVRVASSYIPPVSGRGALMRAAAVFRHSNS
ncbi:MAG: hypothetical protein GAK28_03424 [Luteibacter sp.]|nr:MAG: hypothetical protein GAK28_03424 [Luteibacter sp.]